MACRRYDASLDSDDFREFSFRLLNEPNFLPDVHLDLKKMLEKYNSTMAECLQPWAMVDKANRIGGVFFVTDVEWGHQANFHVWIWNPKCYTPTTHRALDEYLTDCAASNQLDRLVCRTPDDQRLGRLLERLGFRLEGRFKNAWKSQGRLGTLFQYRKLFV